VRIAGRHVRRGNPVRRRNPVRRGARPALRRHARPRLRVVPAPAARARRLPFLFLSIVLVGVLVLAVASLQAVVSQTSFRLDDLTQRNARLQQEYGRLRLQVAELSAPGRIAAEARTLGLQLPPPSDVRTLYVRGQAGSGRSSSGSGDPSFALKGVLGGSP
jgi:cell division protein FtsL